MIGYSDTQQLLLGIRPPNLPTSPSVIRWQEMNMQYRRWWNWWNGQPLNETDPKPGSTALLYPLHLNIIGMVVQKHGGALWGTVPPEVNIPFRMTYREGRKITDTGRAVQDLLETVWYESSGKEILYRGGMEAQFLGGAFYKVKFDPTNENLTYKIKFEYVSPDFVLPIYSTTDFQDLVEVYVMHWIGIEEARSMYGVDEAEQVAGKVLYVEHWTKDTYCIQVGGMVALDKLTGDKLDKPNPFGFVPFVYIPHVPRVGGFYGTSHVDGLVGLEQELNSRMADVGDWVQASTTDILWGRNLTSSFKFIPVTGHNLQILNAGAANPATNKEPEISRLQMGSGAAGIAQDNYIAQLWKHIEKESHLPPVCWGVDEGSQRSALTLLARMWPLEVHIGMERSAWIQGIQRLNWMVIKMLKVKREHIPGYQDGMERLMCSLSLFPIMPQDRELLWQEMVGRKTTGIISRRNALENLGTAEDVDAEMEEIAADMKQEATIKKPNPADQAQAKPI